MNSIASRSRTIPLVVAAAALAGCGVEQVPAEPHPTAGQVLAVTNGPDSPWTGIHPHGPVAIAVDSTRVYVATLDLAPILAIPLEGGEASSVGGSMAAWTLAVDEQRLYWADDTAVHSCNKLDCAGSTTTTPAPYGAIGLTLDAANIYWADAIFNLGKTRIMKTGKDGSPPVELANVDGVGRLAVDAENLYWLETISPAPAYGVMKMPLTGGPSVQLAMVSGYAINNLAVDADNVYFTTSEGALHKVSKSGGPTSVLATDLGAFSDGLKSDGQNVYVGAGGTGPGTLVRVPVGGGPARTLVSGLGGPDAIALDDNFVYIADRNGYEVVKVAK